MAKFFFIILILLSIIGCKSPEARPPISQKSGSFIKESLERNKILNKKEEDQIQKIIKNNPDITYKASESGFWYYYNVEVERDTVKADFGDVLTFDYDVKTLSGNYIYTKTEIGPQTYAMDQEVLFTGLREGLKLMKPTETITFIFPSHKAYGYYGDNYRIGINVPLICEVTLNTIVKKQ